MCFFVLYEVYTFDETYYFHYIINVNRYVTNFVVYHVDFFCDWFLCVISCYVCIFFLVCTNPKISVYCFWVRINLCNDHTDDFVCFNQNNHHTSHYISCLNLCLSFGLNFFDFLFSLLVNLRLVLYVYQYDVVYFHLVSDWIT